MVKELVGQFFERTKEFNEAITGLKAPATPRVPSPDRVRWTITALREEIDEFVEACDAGDVPAAADALVDLVYFALGRLFEMGVPAKAVFDAVHQANMTKERGSLAKRPGSLGHDALKPEGWRSPDHSWLLRFSLDDLRKAASWDRVSPVFKRIAELREAKGSDYNDVPGGREAYFPFGHFSYAHMVHTKYLRMRSLLNAMSTGRKVNFEGLKDTLEDLINYATFYLEALDEGRLVMMDAEPSPRHLESPAKGASDVA